jgi:hypothetical protein
VILLPFCLFIFLIPESNEIFKTVFTENGNQVKSVSSTDNMKDAKEVSNSEL